MNPRILLVEDEPEYFEPFIAALKRQYQLVQADNLTRAVEILSGSDFDLVIVDIMLAIGDGKFPNVDDRRSGLYLIRRIRKDGPGRQTEMKCRKDVPILALTAVSDLSLADKLRDLQVPMVPKPFSLTAICVQIENMLQETSHENDK